ncbi:MAG TPA: glycosyltransferase family 9 protein [Armatimonadota bacterium]|nr:glycosyltransferase family 9 protein [Armatimonadota bacterium]
MPELTILHLLPALECAAGSYVVGLAAALRARGHRCVIVSGGSKPPEQAGAAGARHLHLRMRGLHAPAAVRRLAWIIDREQVDLLHAHSRTVGAVGSLAARLAQIPHLLTVHGLHSPAPGGLERAAAEVERIYRELLAGAPPRRIAVFHLNQVGDLMFSLPALAALRARFPAAEIVSILRPHLRELLQDSPYVDRLILRRGGLAAEARLARGLRGAGFDLVVALSQSASSVLQALACGAPRRVGFVDADLSFLFTRKVHVRGVVWPGKLARLPVCLGADAPPLSYVGMLAIAEALRARARGLLEKRGVASGQEMVAIAPGASGRRRHKAWEAGRFAAVGDHLHRRWGAAVVIVGGAGDAAEAGRIAAAMSAPAVNLAGHTTTGELVAVLERARLLVGIDAGPMHVAAAMGTPTVALFGPTDPRRTGPCGDGHEIVTAGLDCAPCLRGCETRACMTGITVRHVTQAADRVMRGAVPSAGDSVDGAG